MKGVVKIHSLNKDMSNTSLNQSNQHYTRSHYKNKVRRKVWNLLLQV